MIPEENIVIAACLVKAESLDPGGLGRMSVFPHPSTMSSPTEPVQAVRNNAGR
jgi:hypothetical protein